MRILSVGGGSGGHVTPVVAVVRRLHEIEPDTELRVWCDRKYAKQMQSMLSDSAKVSTIVCGKLRRYANLTLAQHLKHHLFKTHLMNIIDMFKFGIGTVQSFVRLIIWKPDAIFLKGGFVCLPVGLSAHLLRIPLVIHDSDTVPGLTNRILARYATKIGTGSPVENYPNYPKDRTSFVGIPIREEIHKLSDQEKIIAKKKLRLNPDGRLILAVGGGGGASNLNRAVAKSVPEIKTDLAEILLVTGRGKSDEITIPEKLKSSFHKTEFMNSDDIALAIGSAEIIISRAGATFVAEFAAVGAPLIIIPSRYLAGDHQTKNAKVYQKAEAAIVIDEQSLAEDSRILARTVEQLLTDKELREKIGRNLSKFSKRDSIDNVVQMILEARR